MVQWPRWVLILPLWNWNYDHRGRRQGGVTGFTRTFMELKQDMHASNAINIPVLLVPLWNWNLPKIIDNDNNYQQFYSYLYGIETFFMMSIISSWKEFYSYLYGIETSFVMSSKERLFAFYSYLYGIETLEWYRCRRHHCDVSLVHFWNWNIR